MQIRNSPGFFGMNTAGAIQGLLLSSITPCFTCGLSISPLHCESMQGHVVMAFAYVAESLVSMLWKATEVDPGIE